MDGQNAGRRQFTVHICGTFSQGGIGHLEIFLWITQNIILKNLLTFSKFQIVYYSPVNSKEYILKNFKRGENFK